MSIDFTLLQREFLGLLTFGFQLVKTNVTEKNVNIPNLNIIWRTESASTFLHKRRNMMSPEMTTQVL